MTQNSDYSLMVLSSANALMCVTHTLCVCVCACAHAYVHVVRRVCCDSEQFSSAVWAARAMVGGCLRSLGTQHTHVHTYIHTYVHVCTCTICGRVVCQQGRACLLTRHADCLGDPTPNLPIDFPPVKGHDSVEASGQGVAHQCRGSSYCHSYMCSCNQWMSTYSNTHTLKHSFNVGST